MPSFSPCRSLRSWKQPAGPRHYCYRGPSQLRAHARGGCRPAGSSGTGIGAYATFANLASVRCIQGAGHQRPAPSFLRLTSRLLRLGEHARRPPSWRRLWRQTRPGRPRPGPMRAVRCCASRPWPAIRYVALVMLKSWPPGFVALIERTACTKFLFVMLCCVLLPSKRWAHPA